MLEKIYEIYTENEKKIEKMIDDDNVLINHMVLPKNAGMPEHFTNSNVYMIIARGKMTLQLNDQDPHLYEHGQIINIPYNTKMNLNNLAEDVLEFFVIKAPNPANYQETK